MQTTECIDSLTQAAGTIERTPGMFDHQLSALGDSDTMWRPREQLYPKLFFELTDLLRQGGL
ncbi:MAG: hypothetical protein A4S12_10045 [Proteobacteria bacterium SG_bin5]|nr:MAG: hypothetical protein A4S12_10045 [Proteobacteria bacterium SG_bin5]